MGEIASSSARLAKVISKQDHLDKITYLFGTEQVNLSELGLGSELVAAVHACGFDIATAIQSKAIPAILKGTDVIIGAETGSGKTLAYLLPILDKTLEDIKNCSNQLLSVAEGDLARQNERPYRQTKWPTTVILHPNKELCRQVITVASKILAHIPTVLTIGMAPSLDSPDPFPDVLVCTPSGLSRSLRGQVIDEPELFASIKRIVLDEADMLLEGQYLNEIEAILDAFKFTRRELIKEGKLKVHEFKVQQILSAATIPSYGMRSIENYIANRFPLAVKVYQEYFHEHHPRIVQDFIQVPDESVCASPRLDLIVQAIKGTFVTPPDNEFDWSLVPSTMVFVNTAQRAKDLAFFLRSRNVPCVEFHKLVTDDEKAASLESFRSGDARVLVSTDAAARGLDLPSVRHVIQAEFALNVVQHLHRIGRSSRAGAEGRATNFYDSSSDLLIKAIIGARDLVKEASPEEESVDVASKSNSSSRTIEQAFSRKRGMRHKHKKIVKERAKENSLEERAN